MKSLHKLGLLLLALPLLFLAAERGGSAQGKEVFAKRCATCHGPRPEHRYSFASLENCSPCHRLSGKGKFLTVIRKSLGSKEVQSHDDASMKKDIVEGTGQMKPVKLTDQEAADVIAFVRTLKK